VSLHAFQRLLCELAASPDLCRAMRADPNRILDRYDLTERERRRLDTVVRQRGMTTNCTLYRANRITSIYTLLPFTCFQLGDDLRREAELFWNTSLEAEVQFKHESARFGAFLKRRIEAGEIQNAYLRETLDFELALNELRFLPRRRIVSELARAEEGGLASLRLHPLTRMTFFRHEPVTLIKLLAEMRPPPYDLAEGEFYLVLDAIGEDLAVKLIDPRLGRVLQAIDARLAFSLDADDAEALVEAGLAVYGG
jgi:hypothetical protein